MSSKLFSMALAVTGLLTLSFPALALVSVCSGEYLPDHGAYGVRHEATWNYYDNWYHDLFVEVESDVSGVNAVSRRDTYVMNEGGAVVHYLPVLVQGEYRISGRLRLGYPQSWGFDGYQILECPSWQGMLEELPEDDDQTSNDEDRDQLAPGAGITVADACVMAADSEACIDELASEEDSESGQGFTAEDRERSLVVIDGMIQGVDERAMVLRTSPGRYTFIHLDGSATLARRTDFSLQDAVFTTGDQLGVIRGRGIDQIRVYRDRRWTADAYSRARAELSNIDSGIERRAVLQAVERGGGDALLHLLLEGQDLHSYRVTAGTSVVFIENAAFDELKPFTGAARVRAVRQADGSLVARRIEILR